MPAALTLDRRTALPPLGWLLEVSGPVARLTCGRSVVVWDDAFFEGAWDGDFAARDFDRAENVFGSGGRLTPEGWVLVPPSHVMEGFYLAEDPAGRITAASNSLALLLAGTGARLAAEGEALAPALLTCLMGIDAPYGRLPTDRGAVLVAYFDNVLLGEAGPVRRPKPEPAPIADFAELRGRLASAVRRVADNAQDPRRPRRYVMLASVSSGFDSPCAAALAREAGCTEAATFINGRGGSNDDGTPVATALGMLVHRITRPASTHELAEAEAAFLANGTQGEDIVYWLWRDLLPGRMLVTGFFGDFWRAGSDVNERMQKSDASGTGLGEFRLRTDYVSMMPPAIAFRRSRDFLRIAESAELAPYRQPGAYTNPIARRIAEEAGVPRAAFGQEKRAVSMLAFRDPRLFSPHLAEVVRARLARRGFAGRLGFALRRRWHYALVYLRFAGKRLAAGVPARWQARAAVWNSDLFEVLRGMPWRVAEHSDPYMGLAFDWACETMVARYRSELAAPR